MDTKSLLTYSDPKSPESEAYRVLRTNIQFSSFDKQIKTIVVTSSSPGEGKTTTISNAAITFAQLGSKVLLIDADMRKPRINKIFTLVNFKGLSTILVNKCDYRDAVQNCSVKNLDIITCGVIPPNPAELLSSNSMKSFISKVKEDYDVVLIDAPPVGAVTDAAILSTIVDGTLLVACSGKVEKDALRKSKELLEQVNANILGVVLNRLDKRASGNSYYYNYYYYSEESHKNKAKKNKKRTI